jgi:phosphoribosylformylglycinamidine synthase
VLLGKPPRMVRRGERGRAAHPPFRLDERDLHDAALRVLRLPTVGDKTFLITIGDRTVGGLVSRDSLVGRYQVPVSDCRGAYPGAVRPSDTRGAPPSTAWYRSPRSSVP